MANDAIEANDRGRRREDIGGGGGWLTFCMVELEFG